jgi:DNA-binding MarR family transcriptional regulator
MHLIHEVLAIPMVTTPEECNCFAVRAAARHVTQLYDQLLAPIGLPVTQFPILAKLKRRGPLMINALADDMVLDRTTLGRNILPLERDGLIRIKAVASDRRAKELHLTKAGEKRLQAARKRWSEAQARFETTFGPRRASDLRTILWAVVACEFAPGGRPVAQKSFLERTTTNVPTRLYHQRRA